MSRSRNLHGRMGTFKGERPMGRAPMERGPHCPSSRKRSSPSSPQGRRARRRPRPGKTAGGGGVGKGEASVEVGSI